MTDLKTRRSATPTTRDQALSFYRTHPLPSISHLWSDGRPRPSKFVWGRISDPAGPGEARQRADHHCPCGDGCSR
jgi:hypothetical protein